MGKQWGLLRRAGVGREVSIVKEKSKKTQMAEFRVLMTCIITHNGLTFHYNTYISRHVCTVLAVAAVTGPHHQFLDLYHFSS